jgi:hypothetical protein
MSAIQDANNRRPTFMFHGDAPILSGGDAYWPDRGPHGLHAKLVNFPAAPAYGFSRDSMGRGRYANGGGANIQGELPLTFYDHAPTGPFTLVWSAEWTKDGVGYSPFFNCQTGVAPNAVGISHRFYMNPGVVEQIDVQVQSVGAGWSDLTNGTPGSGWRRGPHMGIIGVDVVGRLWRDGSPLTTAWTGAYTNPQYDPAKVPTIAGGTGLSSFGTSIYHLSLWPWLFTKTDADTTTRLILDGGLG